MKTPIKLLVALSLVLFVLSACAPAPAPEVVTKKETVIVEKVVEKIVEQKETVIVKETQVVEKAVTATPVPRNKVLRTGMTYADLGTMDPHLASSTKDRALVDMIFNGLLRYKPGDAKVFEPDLAEAIPEPEMVNGKQVWTFKLRKGVMVQQCDSVPAYELTSEDVVYSFKKASNPERSAYAGEYDGMTFEAIDPYTVKITLDQPLSSVLFFPKVADYSGGFIVPKKPIEAMGDEEFKTHAVGTGPFMVNKYLPQSKVVLVANEDYFRGAPLLAGVEYLYVPELNSLEFALAAGEVDVIAGRGEDKRLDRMETLPDTKVDIFGVAEVITAHFNTTVPPLDDQKVRQALAYGISRDEMLAMFSKRVYMKVYSPVPAQFLAGGLTEQEVADAGVEYKVDRDKARQLLAEAGYPDGFSLDVFVSESSSYRKAYENLQAQWAEIGVKLNISMVDHSSMHKLIRQDANPVVLYMAWRPNADTYLTRFYHSDSIVVTGKKPDTNFSHYDKIDGLIEKARVETDPQIQVTMWKEAQLQLLRDCVTYPIIAANQTYIRRSWVDYGHELKSSLALYPQITEKTKILDE